MEQPPNNSFAGPSKLSFKNIQGNEKTAWRLPSDASLFSTSLPVLPHEKFNFNKSEESGQSLEDINIGSFLPGDEDELLAGFMDDFNLIELPTQHKELDDDFFGSGGGLEIESESQDNLVNGISRLSTSDGISGSSISQYGLVNGAGSVSGEHPFGEHPSRTLFVRNINSNVEDSELKSLFEQYGDIRTLYTACKHRGFVMISYYDIRAARNAMRGLQNKPLRRRKLDIHFSIPKDNPSDKDVNQGTLVVFNLDASVSNDDLRQIFGAYGEVKEIRETPHKRHHKFIEFYDVRGAEAALKALNRSDIAGKRIKLEPSRPGGARRGLIQQLSQEEELAEARFFRHQVGSPIGNSPPGVWPNFGSPVEHHNSLHGYSQNPSLGSLSPPGLASILPSHISNPVKIAPIGKDPGRISQVITKANTSTHQNSLPDSKLTSSPQFGDSKPSSSVGTLSGPEFLWGSPTIHSDHLKNSPSMSSSLKGARPFLDFPYTSPHGSFLGSHHHHLHHVGSAPSGFQLERHFGFFPKSPETSYINQAKTLGVTNFGSNNHAMNTFGVSYSGNFSGSGSPMSRNDPMYFGNSSFGANDGLIDRGGRIRRGADSGNQMDNKRQFQLDLENIRNGGDSRTTLMIKNIPNKYTSKMLLAAIDETHKGTYDFLYLPIDFKNKCNVGYAFINMVSPLHITTFYEAFNGKKWEKFNSEKVASLAYGRIQGKSALVSHFQNSSLMNEDKRCRPILFQLEGQGTSDLESFPTGNLNIFIRQPDGSYAGDSLDSPNGDRDEEL